jgi:methyl-accepting chemotaxis protein
MQMVRVFASTEASLEAATSAIPNRQAIRTVMQAYMTSSPSLNMVFVLDANGRATVSTDPQLENQDLSFRPYFQAALNGQLFTSDLLVSRTSGKPSVYYSAPIRRGDQIVGVAAFRSSGAELFELVDADRSRLGEGSGGVLVDENGVRLYDGVDPSLSFKALVVPPQDVLDKIAQEKQFGEHPLESTHDADLADGIGHAPDHPSFATLDRGEAWRVGARRLERKPWTYAVRVPERTFLAPTDAMARLVAVLVGASGLLTAILALLFAFGVGRPITRLVQEARRLASGCTQQDETIRGRRAGRDEVGQLRTAFDEVAAYLVDASAAARRLAAGDLAHGLSPRSDDDELGHAFQTMTASLRAALHEVRGTALALADTSAQLDAAASQTGGAVSQVTDAVQSLAGGAQETSGHAQETHAAVSELVEAIHRIAAGAQEQARQTETTSTTAAQMARDVEDVAAKAGEVAAASQQARVVAEQGAASVRETVRSMADIQDVVQHASVRVDELGRLGERIGAVVETIDDIAEQTNLLALNAAIEAARAGEHGRGFAVVADEVRKLAERSGRETRQIADLIAQVQQGTQEAVRAMASGSRRVAEGSIRADQAGRALTEILAAVDTSVSEVGEIATLAQHLAAGARRVTNAMQAISTVAGASSASTEAMARQASQVTQAIHGIAAVAEEQSASAEEVSASSEEMSAQVEEMTAQAHDLARAADRLRQLVARFNVGPDRALGPVAAAAAPLRGAA